MKKYDYLIVGAGLYGAMFAYNQTRNGKKCLVIDKENRVGGYCYTEKSHGIEIHKYGAHIFRTDSRKVWDFVNSKCEFVPFVNSPIAKYKGKVYNLPFNMNTFNELWGVTTPKEAERHLSEIREKSDGSGTLEDFVLSQIGREMYEIFVKGYTEKQWGVKCSELPSSVMGRIPIRFTYDNNYYRCKYQGVPKGGYTQFIEKLLEGSDLLLKTDFFKSREELMNLADRIMYTGPIDQFYDYRFGHLEYRSVLFEHKYYEDIDNYQGNAVVNYTEFSIPYTRIIEHKHFLHDNVKGTVVSKEFPVDSMKAKYPSYPVPTDKNKALYNQYKSISDTEERVEFGGRLAEYRYYSMDDIISKFIF